MTTKTTKPITTKNPTNEKNTEKDADDDVQYKKYLAIIRNGIPKEQNIIRLNNEGNYIEGREKDLVQLIITNMSADEFLET